MTEIIFQPLGNPITSGQRLDQIADIDPRLTRTNYFDGRLLTAEDLTRDQIYLDQRLREVGRALGSGIISGLGLNFNLYSGELRLAPGRALTSAGRVLEVSRELKINLGDRALISQLNSGLYRRFARALYAVVLRYVEVGTDIAEVFPTDLGAKRGFQYALITESVQMGLVPLPTPLSQQSALQIRIRLMREYLGNDQIEALIPEDAVALGVLAIQNDRPQWLDAELLRHPVRNEPQLGDLQLDLARQYESLLTELIGARRSGGLNGDFAASDYFSLLPPVGRLPKESIDPERGRQGFFPENFQISIAPIRQSDVALIKKESLRLPPIDLNLKEPIGITVLAPLSNQEYGHFAGVLERAPADDPRALPRLDLLRLKLYPARRPHAIDDDASTWRAIWERIYENQLFYARRPARTAETALSGIVLALGTAMPDPPAAPVITPADSGGLLESEPEVLLRRIHFDLLAIQRPPADTEGQTALASLKAEVPPDQMPGAVMAALRILLRIEPRYDGLVWTTLLALFRANRLDAFSQQLLEAADDARPTGRKVAALGAALGLDAALMNRWSALDPA
jgi:hypothetical protein